MTEEPNGQVLTQKILDEVLDPFPDQVRKQVVLELNFVDEEVSTSAKTPKLRLFFRIKNFLHTWGSFFGTFISLLFVYNLVEKHLRLRRKASGRRLHISTPVNK